MKKYVYEIHMKKIISRAIKMRQLLFQLNNIVSISAVLILWYTI